MNPLPKIITEFTNIEALPRDIFEYLEKIWANISVPPLEKPTLKIKPLATPELIDPNKVFIKRSAPSISMYFINGSVNDTKTGKAIAPIYDFIVVDNPNIK